MINEIESTAKTPFFIFFKSRCRSTHLKNLLSSHPEIWCGGEIFHLDGGRFLGPKNKLITKTRKITPDKIEDAIENYSELYRALSGTK